jgi:hypothetical protein
MDGRNSSNGLTDITEPSMYEKNKGYLGYQNGVRDSGSNLSFIKENVPPRVNSSFGNDSSAIRSSFNRNSYLDSLT